MLLWQCAWGYCQEGANCNECNLFTVGHFCSPNIFIKNEFFHCEKQTNKVLLDKRSYFECENGIIRMGQCLSFHRFSYKQQSCVEFKLHNKDFSPTDLRHPVKRSSLLLSLICLIIFNIGIFLINIKKFSCFKLKIYFLIKYAIYKTLIIIYSKL